jgi:hypothetical protein
VQQTKLPAIIECLDVVPLITLSAYMSVPRISKSVSRLFS